ncbi:DUF1534 domain-containing protein [Pseudomonas sp. PA-3-11C]|nr:DUF1534 domain-containing protein [Pseudomonas sp. PA-3-6H]MCF5515184.1 DUF1534 domain-containing protein [Pseudomonas sp. PA-3-6E]MCF5563389.1 DUF1534 domain-containing protein [Pseudomonas sp. PA-3-5D]MCF5567377.1 DUF1534 domain-containing protein [Pseudomonas sp. PA-3-11C]MCF5596163.1 DUF1534 domain-containing protein [Pseudomonas sp. PA-3-10C]NHC54635.1 DUF1534 domain-containing protein [Pseudomonas sp. AU8050]
MKPNRTTNRSTGTRKNSCWRCLRTRANTDDYARSYALRGNLSCDALRHPCTGIKAGRGASKVAFPRRAWERATALLPPPQRGLLGHALHQIIDKHPQLRR